MKKIKIFLLSEKPYSARSLAPLVYRVYETRSRRKNASFCYKVMIPGNLCSYFALLQSPIFNYGVALSTQDSGLRTTEK
jgi:hypothetical protein